MIINVAGVIRIQEFHLESVLEKTASEVRTTIIEPLQKYHMCAKTYHKTHLCAYFVPVLR